MEGGLGGGLVSRVIHNGATLYWLWLCKVLIAVSAHR